MRAELGICESGLSRLVAAAFELGRRAERESIEEIPMDSPAQIHAYLAPDMQALAYESVRVLLLNTPSNPTGAVLTAAEIDAIGEVCERHDLWIVCDEVYADLTFDVPFSSPFDRPQLRERSVSVASISKSHALPGFRSGWAAGSTITCARRSVSSLRFTCPLQVWPSCPFFSVCRSSLARSTLPFSKW